MVSWIKTIAFFAAFVFVSMFVLVRIGVFVGQAIPIQGMLLYASWQMDESDLFLLDVGRRLPVNLTNSSSNEYSPGWTPDGRRIVYVADYDGENNIYFMQPNARQITRLPTSALVTRSPSLSPDGEQIAYISVTSNAGDLLVSYVDGRDVRKLSYFGTYNDILGWVDNDYLVFVSRTMNNQQTYMTHTHQHDIRAIEPETIAELFPQNSPNDRYRVTEAYHSGQRDLLVTSGTTTYSIANHMEHDWSPDSRTIAFVSDRDGNAEIYVVDADGRNLRRLTYTEGDELSISWQPERD